jgi:1-acyl-sn-glycerol-3-phosphate acyltransferase
LNFYIGRFFSYIIFKTLYRLKIFRRAELPEGGFIIAANHNSLADPPLIGASFRRPVYFMAKKELFEIPLFGDLINSTNAFPVKRGKPDRDSIRKAVSMLKAGKIILVFPEGTRKAKGQAQRGISLLAHKAGVPVVPSRIINNSDFIKFRQLKYIVGKPMKFGCPPDKRAASREYKDFASRIMQEIYSLR